ncbi:MAG: hypothetical protein AB7C97_03040 [Oscillospiraceae bacterium]
MALNGIDAQIMIQRTSDYSKDAGNSIRRNDLMQEYASEMRKAEDEARINTVTRQENPDGAQISRERNNSGQNSPEERNKESENEREEPEAAEALRAEGGRFIDITL